MISIAPITQATASASPKITAAERCATHRKNKPSRRTTKANGGKIALSTNTTNEPATPAAAFAGFSLAGFLVLHGMKAGALVKRGAITHGTKSRH